MKLYIKRLRLSATCSIFLSLLLTQSAFAEYRVNAPQKQGSGLEIVVFATIERSDYSPVDYVVPSGNGYEEFDDTWECALTGGGSIGKEETVKLLSPGQKSGDFDTDIDFGLRNGSNRQWLVKYRKAGWQPRIRVTCFRWKEDGRMKKALFS